jgi:biopolymer transport protein ExbD
MAAVPNREHEPLAAMNITPLIDVMLVLLVMLILTIPLATHKVVIDLPTAAPVTADPAEPHRLSIARDGSLAWDGRAVGDGELMILLERFGGEAGGPALEMQTDPEARYERFDAVLAMVKRANITKLGFVGHRPYD